MSNTGKAAGGIVILCSLSFLRLIIFSSYSSMRGSRISCMIMVTILNFVDTLRVCCLFWISSPAARAHVSGPRYDPPDLSVWVRQWWCQEFGCDIFWMPHTASTTSTASLGARFVLYYWIMHTVKVTDHQINALKEEVQVSRGPISNQQGVVVLGQ